MSRPICVHCGAAYGQRWAQTEVVKHREGEPEPPYNGNGIVIKSRSWKVGQGHGSTGSFSHAALQFGPGDVVVYRDVWDGETYSGGCPPFCTNRCAIDYARKAYQEHLHNTSED